MWPAVGRLLEEPPFSDTGVGWTAAPQTLRALRARGCMSSLLSRVVLCEHQTADTEPITMVGTTITDPGNTHTDCPTCFSS